MQRNPIRFDPFLRVKAKVIHESHYDWLIEQVRSHTGNACLIWPFATNRKGFGIVKVKGSRESALVHRIAFQIANGITPKKCVVQTCNDRVCFAPGHLVERKHQRQNPNPTPRGFRKYNWLVRKIASHQSDECLIWPFAAKGKMEYGVVMSPLTPGVNEYVHRLAFFLTAGHWPEPQTLHSCDNPRCFNPYHLSEGTRAENTADMVRKGRANSPRLKGSAHGRSKLTEQQVEQIRIEYKRGDTSFVKLGAKFGVSPHSIWSAIHNYTWKSV